MFKNKTKILSIIFIGLIFISTAFCCEAAEVTLEFENLLGAEDATEFFKSILGNLQGVIAFLALIAIVISGLMYLLSAGSEKMITAAKICLTAALVGLALAAAGPSFLKAIKEIALKDGQMPTNFDEALTIKEIVMNTLAFLLSIFGILAIVSLVVSGAMYIFAAGDESRAEKAKNAIVASIAGIIIAGAALILVRQIVELITG